MKLTAHQIIQKCNTAIDPVKYAQFYFRAANIEENSADIAYWEDMVAHVRELRDQLPLIQYVVSPEKEPWDKNYIL